MTDQANSPLPLRKHPAGATSPTSPCTPAPGARRPLRDTNARALLQPGAPERAKKLTSTLDNFAKAFHATPDLAEAAEDVSHIVL